MGLLPTAAGDSGVGVDALLQYGAVGVIAALALTAVMALYKRMAVAWDRERQQLLDRLNEERARADRLEEELAKLNSMVQSQTMTALNEATRAVSEAISRMRRG